MKRSNSTLSTPAVSVIGLGKIGLPLAASLASRGFQVAGVDVDATKLRMLKCGEPPVLEPGLKDLLQSCGELLRPTPDYEDAIHRSDITFIVVPTPSEMEGGFSLRHVLPACEQIAAAIRHKAEFHLVILTSTVIPGATANHIKPVLERVSGKKCGEGFGLCYNPEFVALGAVIPGILNPEFVLIGESDSRSGDALVAFYKNFCNNHPPIARMSFVNAEITKLALNTFVTTKISFANMLARMCERLPGANVDTVTSALALDGRIGGKYLRGAIGYGGPCFPRDNLALAFLGRQLGVSPTLAEATDRANREEIESLAGLVKSKLPKDGKVGILGLAYKPDTDVVDESQGLLLARSLLSTGAEVLLYDPSAAANAAQALGRAELIVGSAAECVKAADVIVLTTPWTVFTQLDPEVFRNNGKRKVVIDCWRLLDPRIFDSAVEYVALGTGAREESGVSR